MPFDPKQFGAGAFRILLGLGAVRLRPHMYIGDTQDGTGLHNMVIAAVRAALQERFGRRADHVAVILNADGSCTVSDDGAGLSGEPGPEGGLCQIEIVMTQFERLDSTEDKERAALCVVNVLSHRLKVEAHRGGKVYDLEFRHGVPLSPPGIREAKEERYGTTISFRPSADVFSGRVFDRERLDRRLAVLSQHSGARIDLTDAREAPET